MPTLHCLADLCLIPVSTLDYVINQWLLTQIGTANASVSEYVTDVVRVIKASGLHYVLHSAGTTIGE